MNPEDRRPIAIEKIIFELRREIKRDNEGRPSAGIDLSLRRNSLNTLLGDLADAYTCAIDDFNARTSADKPKRIWEDNFKNTEFKHSPPIFEYGETMDGWDEHWVENYHRPKGNPGINRTGERAEMRGGRSQRNKSGDKKPAPIAPLHVIFSDTKRWWLSEPQVTSSFNPTFGRNYFVDGSPYDLEYCNCPARLLCIIAEWLDETYMIKNVAGIVETRKKRKSKRAQATG